MEIVERDIEDVVRALGYLCLGSRFKRLGEQLQAGTQEILAELGSTVPVAQLPLLAALDRLGPLSVGEMARAMGVSQPGITRSLLLLAEIGVIDMTAPVDDRRRRIARLTQAGRTLVQRSQAGVWRKVEAAVADLCDGLDGPLLEQLARIEDGLAVQPLRRRGCHATSA
jgi:DNA-binding MarR family transcriptional regulator